MLWFPFCSINLLRIALLTIEGLSWLLFCELLWSRTRVTLTLKTLSSFFLRQTRSIPSKSEPTPRLRGFLVLDELITFRVFHRWPVLNRFAMFFVVDSDINWVQTQYLSKFLADVGFYSFVFSILKPNLQKSLFNLKTQTGTNNTLFFELLT